MLQTLSRRPAVPPARASNMASVRSWPSNLPSICPESCPNRQLPFSTCAAGHLEVNQVEHPDEQNADNRSEKNDQRCPGATDALFQQGNEGDPDADVGLGIDLFEPGGDSFELDAGGLYRRFGSKPGINFQARFPSAPGARFNGQWRPYRNGLVGKADAGGQHTRQPSSSGCSTAPRLCR